MGKQITRQALGFLVCATLAFSASCTELEQTKSMPPTLPMWDTVVSDRQGLMDAHRAGLDAFVWPFSIDKTEQPTIYVRSGAPFTLQLYRLGWYEGAGAELVYDSGPALAARNADASCGSQSSNADIAAGEHDFGLVECSWADPVQPTIPQLTSGLHLAIVTANIEGVEHSNAAVFAVRDDASSSRLVIINPTDAQAYTDWSDVPDADYHTGFVPFCFYGQSVKDVKDWPRAVKISFNRPMTIFDFFKTDYPLIRFLEREGLPYSLATDYDLHSNINLMATRKSAIISGHGEYWSYDTRTRLEDFVSSGGNLVAMAANSGYWEIRYEDSPAGLPAPVIVGYKESATDSGSTCSGVVIPKDAASCADPLYVDGDPGNDHLVTTYFRAPPVNMPEQLLFGVQYQVDPAANTFELPVTLFTNEISSMQSLGHDFPAAGDQDIGAYWNAPDPTMSQWLGVIGWEADVIHPHLLLAMSPAACLREIGATKWPWNAEASNAHQAHVVLYRPNESSGHVFSGLSMLWSWGLDDWAALHYFGGAPLSRTDARLQTLTRNMLASADNDDFSDDCAAPFRMSYRFANTGPGANGKALILKEDDLPGRWSVIPVEQDSGNVLLKPNPFATERLSGWAVSSDAYNLFVADVNGDASFDLVSKDRNQPGNWNVALSNGNAFQPAMSPWLTGWAVASDAYDLFVVDVNGDKMADLVSKEKSAPGAWYVALSDGSSFKPGPTPWLTGWAVASDAYDLFVVDVNGDNKADLVSKEKNPPGAWYVALSDGASFKPEPMPWLTGWAVASDAYNLFVADVNGDNKVDLVSKEKNPPGAWYVALSDGASFKPEPTPWLIGWAVVSDAYNLFVTDVSGDNKADIVSKEKGPPGNWYVALSNGASFQVQTKAMLEP